MIFLYVFGQLRSARRDRGRDSQMNEYMPKIFNSVWTPKIFNLNFIKRIEIYSYIEIILAGSLLDIGWMTYFVPLILQISLTQIFDMMKYVVSILTDFVFKIFR